jgi:peptidoglycan/xylan/chitin deacetylase (PgdA/CDA1 family)
MPIWKQLLLSLYYHGSWPGRSVRNRLLAVTGRAPLMVIMYHRVADDAANAWTTRNDVFVRQIAWLQRHFELISLAELQGRVRARRNPRPAVSITFDDGYAANCDQALPLLVEQNIPFTYFVTSSAVLKGGLLPHDVAMGNRLAPNTLADLQDLVAAGVEIGAHTRTHADLGTVHDEPSLYDEVVTAGRELEDALAVSLRYFAFPFGQHRHLNRRAFQLAAEAGYEGVVSAYGGYNFAGDDAFHLQRMGVDGPMIRLKNWTTLDPFKQWKIPRYEYRERERPVMVEGATNG